MHMCVYTNPLAICSRGIHLINIYLLYIARNLHKSHFFLILLISEVYIHSQNQL